MAQASGCYDGVIENGRVTGACQSYSDGKVYCRYYCNDGYTKRAPNVYCAGNDRWVPVGYPGDDACMKDTDYESGCHNMFFDTGYVATSTCAYSASGSQEGCRYNCYKGYNNVSSTVYCAGNQWLPTGTSPVQNATPCIQTGVSNQSNPTTSVSKLPPPEHTTTRRHTTTVPGYYDDPSLRMDISPAIFVGAVIGGIAIIVAVVFAIFFRAHRKTARDSRVRSLFLVNRNQLRVTTQGGVGNYPNISQEDDSQFRDIAHRIMSHTTNDQQLNSSQPPPYETLSPSNNDPPSLPYTTVNIPAGARASTIIPDTFRRSGQYQNTRNIQDSFSGPVGYDELDKPPPYEQLGYQATGEHVPCVQQKELQPEPEAECTDTPPPYTAHNANNYFC